MSLRVALDPADGQRQCSLPSVTPSVFEIRCELPFTRLITVLASPYFRFDDVFLLVVGDNNVHSTTTGLHFNVYKTTDVFHKLVKIREQKMSANRFLRRIRDLQNFESLRVTMKSRKLSSNALYINPSYRM